MLVVDSSEKGCAVLDSNDLQAGREVMLRACWCVALFVCFCSETVFFLFERHLAQVA